MLLHIPQVLSRAEVADIRQRLDAAGWVDGLQTAGAQAATSKKSATGIHACR